MLPHTKSGCIFLRFSLSGATPLTRIPDSIDSKHSSFNGGASPPARPNLRFTFAPPGRIVVSAVGLRAIAHVRALSGAAREQDKTPHR
eukprot:7053938-Prymnesium_polylepis.3